ncbi:MAG: M20/M25/M40 family metallo-hydrolase [Muribaculaceae bacterium]|nr:M20/M25/M40 family metallo-hydrolase [Muribaculaceae bacterium]
MKTFILALVLLITAGSPVYAAKESRQQKAVREARERGMSTISRNAAEAHLVFLASDELEGREAGQRGSRVAAKYIESYFRQLGLEPWDGKDYMQPFDAYRKERQKKGRLQVHPDSIAELRGQVHQRIPMRNVMARIQGKNPDEYVVIGAHYDHLGVDELLEGDRIYNGADDNASGVQAVLQIARAFKEAGVQPERTIIFALWDGEEKGLLGSEHFMLTVPMRDSIKGYLNFDMIGRNTNEANPEHVVYFYTEAHPDFEKWLRNDIDTYGFNLKPDYRAWDRPIGGGDNGSFAKRDIPVIWYHTDWHPDYHMPSDEAPLLNWNKMLDITRAAYLNLWNLANEAEY